MVVVMNSALNDLSNFIHEAQKERGSAALFLHGKTSEYANALEAQFAVVDAVTKPLEYLPKNKSTRIEPFLNIINYLQAKRKYIISRMMEPAEVLTFYTQEIITPAIEIVQELAILDVANTPARVSAFINFLQWKERVGLERAMGTQLINMDWANAIQFTSRIEFIISEQNAYERMFLALADEHGGRVIADLKSNNAIFHKIHEINECLISGKPTITMQGISAVEWFALFTAKMDLLHEAGIEFLANLTLAPEKTIVETPVITNSSAPLETSVRAYFSTIEALPLFARLDCTTLQDILKHARVTTHNKGSLIFMQGEQASRFYIILEGWVKLFKGNSDGQESVLHVMTKGETLLETVLFSNAPFPVNAQAVDAVKLLSIPASIIREKIQNNKDLSYNMLSTVAERSQNLIHQFEQLTLKTVTQRVGWFVLKLFLENGERKNGTRLPYDKSLIASYLGMKPETFSRTLQVLKEQGIDIDKHSITLQDVFALCDYCDMELASKCSRAGTAECPNGDCAQCA